MPAENTPSLYDRRMAAGCGHWADVYGGKENSFEIKRFHNGYFVDGTHCGKEVDSAIDLFHGVLCRIVRPNHPQLHAARERAEIAGSSHIGKTHLQETIVELMERLKQEYDRLGIGKGRVLLSTTGSGANAMAHNLARAFTRGKGEIIGLKRNYHGNDYQGKGLCNAPGWQGEFPPQIPNEHGIKRHYPHGNPERVGEDLDVLQKDLKVLASGGKRPVMFFEDIQGVGGSFANPGEQYLTDVAEMVGQYGGVAVNDNVQSGMRRGSYLSVPKWLLKRPQTPLLVTLAKALGNGVPIGAVLVPEVIVDDMKAHPARYGLHWDTFAEQIETAGQALAVHDIYHREDLGAHTPRIREAFLSEIEPLIDSEKGPVTEVRGDGLMIGLALKDTASVGCAVSEAPKFGVIIGKGADALRVAPLADMPLDLAKEAGQRVAKLLDSLPKEPK